jgi:hypothetical protein
MPHTLRNVRCSSESAVLPAAARIGETDLTLVGESEVGATDGLTGGCA